MHGAARDSRGSRSSTPVSRSPRSARPSPTPWRTLVRDPARSRVVEIRPSALVITSPGPLPEPVTVDTLRQARAPRNPSVIDVLRKLGLAEDSGRGIDLLEDALRDDVLPDPVFEDDGASVRVAMRIGRVIIIAERAWLQQYHRDQSLTVGRSVPDTLVDLVEAAACFANHRGGMIVVGVRDRRWLQGVRRL